MATKFTDLPSNSSPSGNDLIPTRDMTNNVDKSITLSTLFSWIFGGWQQTRGAAGYDTSATGTSYSALATPVSLTVTVPSSGKVALMWSFTCYPSNNDVATFVTIVASGANTITANDSNAARSKVNGGGGEMSCARCLYLSGLTAGSTTFSLQRRNSAYTSTIEDANLIVIPIYG